ncbi:hypothetical protein C9F09_17050, partial [Salmonella enterica subsp. enterica serovar Wilhelmsburg]
GVAAGRHSPYPPPRAPPWPLPAGAPLSRPTPWAGGRNRRAAKRSASRQAFNMRCCGGKSVNPFEKRFFY